MKAVVLHEYGGPEKLKFEDNVPDPQISGDTVLIAAAAASVNPIDWKLRSGMRQKDSPLSFPAILGRDVSGVVRAVGTNVKQFKPGDRVLGLSNATYAELVAVDDSDVTHLPDGVDLAEAAASSLPLEGRSVAQGPDVGANFRSVKYPAARSWFSRGSRSVPIYSSRKSSSSWTLGARRNGPKKSAHSVIGSRVHCGKMGVKALRTSGLFAIHKGRIAIPNPLTASFSATVGSLVITRKRMFGVTMFLPLLSFQASEPKQV